MAASSRPCPRGGHPISHSPRASLCTPVVLEWDLIRRDGNGLLALSRTQEERFGGWSRPSEFLEQPLLFDDVGGTGGMYLVQDIITDCSVVASLSAAAAWEHTHSAQVTTQPFLPKPQTRLIQDCNKQRIRLWKRKVHNITPFKWLHATNRHRRFTPPLHGRTAPACHLPNNPPTNLPRPRRKSLPQSLWRV